MEKSCRSCRPFFTQDTWKTGTTTKRTAGHHKEASSARYFVTSSSISLTPIWSNWEQTEDKPTRKRRPGGAPPTKASKDAFRGLASSSEQRQPGRNKQHSSRSSWS